MARRAAGVRVCRVRSHQAFNSSFPAKDKDAVTVWSGTTNSNGQAKVQVTNAIYSQAAGGGATVVNQRGAFTITATSGPKTQSQSITLTDSIDDHDTLLTIALP